MNKKSLLGSIAGVLFFLLLLLLGIDPFENTPTENSSPTPPKVEIPIEQIEEGTYTVNRVIDGDTISIDLGNDTQTIRLIGVNTPESVDPRRPVECFGREASLFTKNLVEGKRVTIEFDPSQGKADKYNRLLAYVYLEDGTLVNKQLIAEGYAYEYTFAVPYKYQTEFKSAQQEAQKAQKGLWQPGVCES